MKRKKYNIAKEFQKWNKLNPPINKFFAPLFQCFLRPLMKMQRSKKDCLVERKCVNIDGKKVRFLVYSPRVSTTACPCLIYYHGGGYVLPAAPYHYRNARKYASLCGCKVFFPDYPLSPKHKFPTPSKVCFDFYKYILENAEAYGIDKRKIALGGDSAGANIAAIVCMMATDNNIAPPLAQMLIYPVINTKTPTPSMLEFDTTGMCNNKDIEKYGRLYYGKDKDKYERYLSPLNQENLSKFPATYIETAEFDCLRDEGKLFAEELKKNGVLVTENNTRGTIHGYDIVKKSKIVEQSINKRIEFLNAQFDKKEKI